MSYVQFYLIMNSNFIIIYIIYLIIILFIIINLYKIIEINLIII